MGRCQTCDRFDRRCPANILGVNQFLKTADIKSIPESTKKELVYILWLKYFFYLFTHIYMMLIRGWLWWSAIIRHDQSSNIAALGTVSPAKVLKKWTRKTQLASTSWLGEPAQANSYFRSADQHHSIGGHADSADWAPSSPVSKTALSWIGAPSRYMDKNHGQINDIL